LRFALPVAVLLTIGGAASTGANAQTAAPPAAPASPDKVRALFEAGQTHYTLGEYEQAIARFREAYELSGAPMMLFNIAQAHRLKGDCRKAMEIYRHFLRLAPDTPYKEEVDRHLRTLEASCTPQAPPVAVAADKPAVAVGMNVAPAAAPPASGGSMRRRAAITLLVSGVALGIGAGALYWWNDDRHERWAGEDRFLGAAAPTDLSNAEWAERQRANDDLLRSIRRADAGVVVLGAVSGACLLGSALLALWPSQGMQVAAGPDGARLLWVASWP
jgi:tetratricopeptide (TPR) repeat protein